MPQTRSKSTNIGTRIIAQLLWITYPFRFVGRRIAKVFTWFRNKANRANFANIFMLCFIIFTSIGAGMIFLPAGLVVAGVACGLFGFLLGLE